MIALITIPHTGTQFFKRLLEQYAPVEAMHCTDNAMEWIRQNRDGVTLVTTTRDWSAVRASWQRRGRDSEKLRMYLRNYLDLLNYDPIILSVDSFRQERLDRLQDKLGVLLRTDWTPVNAS